jgi:ABC-type nitrate/sulfonate/bicarbonate transport system substrate-binding protein
MRGWKEVALAGMALAMMVGVGSARAAESTLNVATPAIAFSFVPVNIGIEKGFFQKHGVTVNLITFRGGAPMMQAAIAGSVDIVVGSGSDFVYLRKGVPLVAIAQMAGPPNLFGVVVWDDSGIKTVDDLKNTKMGISTVGSMTEWLARDLALWKGWGPQGIEPVAIGSDEAGQATALKLHQVSAVMGTAAFGAQLEVKHEGHLLMQVNQFLGDIVIHSIEATNAVVARDPEAVRNFLAGWFETIRFMRQNKAETVALARQVTHYDEAVESREYDLVMPMFSTDGRFTKEGLKNLVALLSRHGAIPADSDLTKYYNESFLPRS